MTTPTPKTQGKNRDEQLSDKAAATAEEKGTNKETRTKQTEANGRNATKARGHGHRRGRPLVAQNAPTHGLLTHASVIPDEDAAAFAVSD